jgi:hypothetical protein
VRAGVAAASGLAEDQAARRSGRPCKCRPACDHRVDGMARKSKKLKFRTRTDASGCQITSWTAKNKFNKYQLK